MARQLEFWDDDGLGERAECVQSPAVEDEKAGEPPRAATMDPQAVEALRVKLCQFSGMQISLKVTNNSHSLMRVVHEPGGLGARLNLHWIFVGAPQTVVKTLAGWVKHPAKLRQNSLLRCYMRENSSRIPAGAQRRVTIVTQGRHYDLSALYDDVNAAEFDGAVTARITWGVMQPVGGGRSGHLRLGSFNDTQNLIRIHPVLDNAEVPAFVVRSIVFHEMLHAFLGIEKEDGKRRKVHHAAFRERECRYKDHATAEAWIGNTQNMRMLIRTRKNGRP